MYIKTEVKESVATLTINRPEKLNALNSKVIDEFFEEFTKLEHDLSVKIILLRGAGEKAFIAGADIKEMAEMDTERAKQFARRGQHLTEIIENSSKPVIAVIQGYALGGGCEIALSAHIRIGTENARLGQPEVGLGLIAGFGGTQRLQRIIGYSKAIEYLITGKMMDARTAQSLGLLNHVVSTEELEPFIQDFIQSILKNSPSAVRTTLESVRRGRDVSIKQGLQLESDLFSILFTTGDMKEGTSAFLEKRKPKFKGN